jgi:hypothetical protein
MAQRLASNGRKKALLSSIKYLAWKSLHSQTPRYVNFVKLVEVSLPVQSRSKLFHLEPRAEFLQRCEKAVSLFHERHTFNKSKAIIIVSHAAGCIALSQVLTRLPLSEITPAGPCSIYGFSRTSNTDVWTVDAHDKDGGLNGFTSHLSDMGSKTVPWNNFGDGTRKFYTGPATSRFAPEDAS